MNAATTSRPARGALARVGSSRRPAPAALTAREARALDEANAKVAKARRALEDAEKDREKLRDRVRPKLRPGREVPAGAFLVKRTVARTTTFRLADYLTAGGKITAAMAKHVTRGRRETWTVKRVK